MSDTIAAVSVDGSVDAVPADYSPKKGATAFAFGDPEPVLDRTDMLACLEVWSNGRWYQPPVPMAKLARVHRVSPHHSSAIAVKRNMLVRSFRPSRWMDRSTFKRWAVDYLATGNGYVERIDNLARRPMTFKHSMAVYTRVGIKAGQFYFVKDWGKEHVFRPDSVHHIMEYDIGQEIYGVPEYLSALQSAFLNEAATLFRRRYYLNGSHAGFVFYLSEPSMDDDDVNDIRTALRDSKGPGNFRNLFMHAPNGKKDGVQIIPISEVAAKDEFLGIKNTSRDDVLAAHRVPPQLLGIIPQTNGGFGPVKDASETFFMNEIEPLQAVFLELNDWAGVEAVAFDPYQGPVDPSARRIE